MANKRSLKRVIHLVCEELFAEGIALSLYGTKAQSDSANALLYSIIKMEAAVSLTRSPACLQKPILKIFARSSLHK